MPHSWTCPFCDRIATISDSDTNYSRLVLDIENAQGKRSAGTCFRVCPNPDCKEFSLHVDLYGPQGVFGGVIRKWTLVPDSKAVSWPSYIPKSIVDDYREACLIADLSPKASATLSRRCLQGIIRDFWGIRKSRLVDEIEGVKDKVDSLTWDAIDAVRKIGNIGAHMEKDINIIVDVEPEEATMLIGLLEMLIKDWYVAKHERQLMLRNIIKTSEEKKQKKVEEKT
ncbi:DUF4145 domain-containing protein [Paenibacillus sp. NPDC058177]|uniref:DUF4145 domain-containing protein n=1 Tax=Paenibacillus sp. NPDC058177 TaxID=3346369 RepID=UPI0036DC6998